MICPLFAMSEIKGDVRCLSKDCAFYNNIDNMCAIKSLSLDLAAIRNTTDELGENGIAIDKREE